MKIYHRLAQADAGGPGSAVALGFFDGVHIGHRSVIGAAVSAAAAGGLTAGVFTFRLPLSSHLKGGRLQTEEGKHQVMERLGVQLYLEPAFEEVCGQSPEEFVELVLEKALRAKAVFCGDNFTFGKKAAGNVDTLRRLCGARGIRVVQVEMARWQGEKVSSSRIRAALEAGDIPAANAMLGRPYAIDFEVAHGKGLGRTLGMPTINQRFPPGFQLPRQGVYATRVLLGEKWLPSVTGLGSRPTVNDDVTDVTCETFIPGFSGQVYGRRVPVEFLRYLDAPRRFENTGQLRAAVMGWAQASLDWFDRRGACKPENTEG